MEYQWMLFAYLITNWHLNIPFLLAHLYFIIENEMVKALDKKHSQIFSITLIIFFLLDFLTKRWAISESFREIVVIPRYFYITSFHKNDGIAFGIDLPLWIQVLGSLIILFLLMRMGFDYIQNQKKTAFFESLLLGAVIGGGLGNLLDRVVNGYVIDFIVLQPFPVFNVADIGITVGLGFIFATMVLSYKKTK